MLALLLSIGGLALTGLCYWLYLLYVDHIERNRHAR